MPKNLFSVEPPFQHGEIPGIGILVANLGTPAAPTAQALRPYLRQFLWDPRVIELSRPLWWTILHLFVLTRRPAKSAELYKRVWTPGGSPLLLYSERLTRGLEVGLREEIGEPVHAELGMTYGEPSIPRALAALKAKGCRRLLVLPLFSHYSSTSTGAVFDAVMKELMTWRWVPELRTIHAYGDDPALIRALASSIRERWAADGEPEKLVLSFHGIPRRYFENGDPYHCQCHKTARLVATELGLAPDRWMVTFQSRFGSEEWLQPYTDMTLEALARSGTKSIDVVCPGFAVDCLETIDEIGRENRHVFESAGGERYRFLPCLNDRPEHVDFLRALSRRHLGGWATPRADDDGAGARREAEASRARAEALRSRGVRPDGAGA